MHLLAIAMYIATELVINYVLQHTEVAHSI